MYQELHRYAAHGQRRLLTRSLLHWQQSAVSFREESAELRLLQTFNFKFAAELTKSKQLIESWGWSHHTARSRGASLVHIDATQIARDAQGICGCNPYEQTDNHEPNPPLSAQGVDPTCCDCKATRAEHSADCGSDAVDLGELRFLP